ncbi:MAG: hypothetical protein AABY13_05635 [Nanoarchaeota archaeon]
MPDEQKGVDLEDAATETHDVASALQMGLTDLQETLEKFAAIDAASRNEKTLLIEQWYQLDIATVNLAQENLKHQLGVVRTFLYTIDALAWNVTDLFDNAELKRYIGALTALEDLCIKEQKFVRDVEESRTKRTTAQPDLRVFQGLFNEEHKQHEALVRAVRFVLAEDPIKMRAIPTMERVKSRLTLLLITVLLQEALLKDDWKKNEPSAADIMRQKIIIFGDETLDAGTIHDLMDNTKKLLSALAEY